jgi:hypothetical protein
MITDYYGRVYLFFQFLGNLLLRFLPIQMISSHTHHVVPHANYTFEDKVHLLYVIFFIKNDLIFRSRLEPSRHKAKRNVIKESRVGV